MRVLLDTCVFLWVISGASDLSSRACEVFQNPDNEVFLSSVSVWEIVVKHSLGRLPLPEPPGRFIQQMRVAHGIEPLPLDEDAVLYLHRLPRLHKDPFGRMIICQAIHGNMTILTPDRAILQYPVATVW